MNGLRLLGFAGMLAAMFASGMAFQKLGAPMMQNPTHLELQEPLLLEVLTPEAQQRAYHMLPAGTALYKDYAFPEGHIRYIVYVNIKAPVATRTVVSDKPNFTAPLWGEPVRPEDLPMLLANTPVSKADLVRILKARKMTREELAQIVREWQD
ncbi:hypothetical protein [Massilia timonae]|uniref:hypothetical protein n=1 Tax=Massilia timonae TaxID=47229 RepID=UPI0028A18B1A|nr:hypothetical protein [Massilia timonae]